jgi:outer membrane protein assembly factor BamB
MNRRGMARLGFVLSIGLLMAAIGAVPAFASVPKITSFTPISGPVGTHVTIKGANFTGATEVAFNAVPSTYSVDSAIKITATVPVGATTGPISVTTPTGMAISNSNFTVVPGAPTVGLSKTSGPPSSDVKVNGTNFGAREGVDVFFDETDLALVGTDGSGSFSGARIKVPSTAEPGTHWISAEGRRSGSFAQTSFTVQTDWPQFRNGPKHTGRNTTENVLNPGNVGGMDLDWSYQTDGNVGNGPVVANGLAYVASNATLFALDATTGTHIWSFSNGSGIFSTPAVSNGLVYVGWSDGTLYALNASTGAQVWSFTTGGGIQSSPAVTSGVVYIGSADGSVYALNASTGALIWSSSTGNYVISSPAVANGAVYVGGYDGKVYAFDASTGTPIWSSGTGNLIASSPSVAGGAVYIGSVDGKVYAFDATFGNLLWSYTTGSSIISSPAVANGVVYIGSDDDNVYALNGATGGLLWSHTTGFFVESSPAVANGVVYVGSGDGHVYGMSAASGATLWSYAVGTGVSSSPAVANGVVYVGCWGSLCAFDLAGGSMSVARPKAFELKPDLHLQLVKGKGGTR